MGLLGSIGDILKKALPSRAYRAMIAGRGWEDYNRWDKRRLIEQGYERNAAFYRAVNLIAQTVASMPILVEYDSGGRRLSSANHPVIDMLDRDEGQEELVEALMSYWLVTGEAYAQVIESTGNGRPLGLVVLPSQNINPVLGTPTQPIAGYLYRDNTEIEFSTEEIIYWRFQDLRQYFHGISPGVALGELLDLNNAAITWNKNIALGGGVPSLAVKAPGITQEEAERLKDSWQNQSGATHSHRLKVVSENITFEKLAVNPNDAEWSNAIMQSMRSIFMALGVSSELMNDAANKTYSNYQEARKALYLETCIPLARRFYAKLSRRLSRYYLDKPKILVDVDAIDVIQEDRALRVKRLVEAVNSGIITPNEARDELGYTRSEDATADALARSFEASRLDQEAFVDSGGSAQEIDDLIEK